MWAWIMHLYYDIANLLTGHIDWIMLGSEA